MEDSMARRKATVPTNEDLADESSAHAGAEEGNLPPDELRRRIAETAYFLAAARNFADGDPQQDWLEAEIMVRATIAEDRKP